MGDAEMELDRLEQIFGRDNTYVELQNGGTRHPAAGVPGAARARGEARAAARRDGRRPLPRRHRRLPARGAPLHPVRRLAEEPEPLEVRDERVLLQDRRTRWRSTSPGTRTRCAGRSRSPSAATSRSSSGRILLPKFPTPEGRDAFDYLVELCEKGLAKRYGKVDAGARRAPPVRAQDDPRDGLRRLLPDRRRTSSRSRGATASRSARAAAAPPARSPPTASGSRTSTRCATASCSSGSSTRPARTCPTWTSTSPSRAASA